MNDLTDRTRPARVMAKARALLGAAAISAMLAGCVTPASEPPEATAATAEPSVIADPAAWPAAQSPAAITDPATEAQITALMARMTLEQKVGQLIQADIASITPADLATYPIGSLLAGGDSGPGGNDRARAAEWLRMVEDYRAASLRPAANGVAIPVIFGIDAVHGHNNVPDATIFPHNIGLGAARDADLIRRIGAATAVEIAGTGIEWTFAPTLAVPQDMRWGRTYEGYSSDPAIIAKYARAMVLGLQGALVPETELAPERVAATAKHFLGDGGTLAGKDQGDAAISERALADVHGAGYPPAIDAGALSVMASFSSWNGVKMHGNESLLTGVLKDRMGFEGFVVGDWNGHGQIPGCSSTDCPQAINAGLDMYMAPDSWKELYDSTLRQARDGVIPAQRIDDAVRRILRVKMKLGLFDEDRGGRGDLSAIGSPEHLALAREAVAKSLVLLKNNGSVLPIRPGAKVLVTGPGAENMAMQAGGWTISWQGRDVTKDDFPNGQTIWQALSEAIEAAGGTAQLSPDGSAVDQPDVAIVVYGESPYAEGQGDRTTLDYQPAEASDLATLQALKAKDIPVVSLFLSGRAMFTNPEINASDAFVAAWLPGTQARGIADVLVADKDGTTPRDFTGTLPFAWPATAVSPIEQPLFPRGFGLTYDSDAMLPALPEDPGVEVAASMNDAIFFGKGRAPDPWTLALSDDKGSRPVGASVESSPGGALAARSVDVTLQGDGMALRWTGRGAAEIWGPPADLAPANEAGRALSLTMRIDGTGGTPVRLFVGEGSVPLDNWLGAAEAGSLETLRIPLRCFAGGDEDLTEVGMPVRITAGAGLSVTLTSARLAAGTDADSCPS